MKAPNLYSPSLLLPLCISLGFLTVSCSESKIAQCQKITQITIETANKTKELSSNGKIEAPEQTLKVAEVFEKSAEKMKNLSIEDPQLREYQSGFVTMYLGWGDATRNFIKNYKPNNIDNLKNAKQRLDAVAETEKKLVAGMNSYCQQ
jgi:hypothetical protein